MPLSRKKSHVDLSDLILSNIKTVAANDDYILMLDVDGIPYKIKKTDLLAGLSIGGTSGSSGGGTSGSSGESNADTYFRDVILLLKGIGTNGSTDIVDSSNSARTPSKIGNPIISIAKSKFDVSSIYFDGSSAIDYQSNNFNFPGDFTIDFWFNSSDISKACVLVEMRPDGQNGNFPEFGTSGGAMGLYSNGVLTLQGSSNLANNTWYYAGLKRVAGLTSLWANGTEVGSYYSGVYSPSGRLLIGGLAFRYAAPSSYFYGYISGFRVTNGNRDLSIIPTRSFPAS